LIQRDFSGSRCGYLEGTSLLVSERLEFQLPGGEDNAFSQQAIYGDANERLFRWSRQFERESVIWDVKEFCVRWYNGLPAQLNKERAGPRREEVDRLLASD
jgi:hypothetical protein